MGRDGDGNSAQLRAVLAGRGLGELEVQKVQRETRRDPKLLKFFSPWGRERLVGCFALSVGATWFPPLILSSLKGCVGAHPQTAGIKELRSSTHISDYGTGKNLPQKLGISLDEQESVKYECIRYLGVSGKGDHGEVTRWMGCAE